MPAAFALSQAALTSAAECVRVSADNSVSTADCKPIDMRFTPAAAIPCKNFAVAVFGVHSTVNSEFSA